MRPQETPVRDVDSSVNVSVRVHAPGNSQSTVMCDKIYLVTNSYLVADGNEIRLATERIQVRTKDLDILSYLGTLAAEVPDWVLMKP